MLGELNPEQIEQALQTALVGRIGCYAEGKIYVVPISYAYDGESIYGHSRAGMKVHMMRQNPTVCFEIEDVADMGNWRSVIAWGQYEELHGAEAESGMRKLINRFMPLQTSETASPHPTAHTSGEVAVIFRIHLQEKTGRFEKR